ncbi:MAG: response regulator [Chloroflexi bacterium]|nr:response regulator [Chloroflexota bacterium]
MRSEPILVVEDSPIDLKLFKTLLELGGYAVQTASSAQQAEAVLQTFHPRLILMDFRMRGTGGLELTRRLKADPATQDILIVGVTAYQEEYGEQQARDAGCDAYVKKPIDAHTFLDVIGRLLARQP